MRYAVERLETRLLLAASVKVRGNGSVQVTGDDGDNFVVVTNGFVAIDANADGDYDDPDDVVQELDGDVRDIKVNLKGGDDLINFRGSNFGAIQVKTGDGDDAMQIDGSLVQGKVNVNLGDGNDCFRIDGSELEQEAKLNLGHGDDDLEVAGSLLNRGMSLKTGKGVDGVQIGGSEIDGTVNVNLGKENDAFVFQGSLLSGGDGKINGGSGTDAFVSGNGMLQADLEAGGIKVKGMEEDLDIDLLGPGEIDPFTDLATRLNDCETELSAAEPAITDPAANDVVSPPVSPE